MLNRFPGEKRVQAKRQQLSAGTLGTVSLGIALTLSILSVQCMMPEADAAGTSHKSTRAAVKKVQQKPVPASVKQSPPETDNIPTLNATVTQTMVKKKPKNCGIWVVPGRGFVDTCEELETLVEVEAPAEENADASEPGTTQSVAEIEDQSLSPIEFSRAEAEQENTAGGESEVIGGFLPSLFSSDYYEESPLSGLNMLNILTQTISTPRERRETFVQETSQTRATQSTHQNFTAFFMEAPAQALTTAVVEQTAPVVETLKTAMTTASTQKPEMTPNSSEPEVKAPKANTDISGEKIVATNIVMEIEPPKTSGHRNQKWLSNPVSFVVRNVLGAFRWVFHH
jgi:hypothetical protein